MNSVDIVNSYLDALHIVIDARIDSQRVQAVWDKLYRISKYLDAQVESELAEVLA